MTDDLNRLRDEYGDPGTGYKPLPDEEAAKPGKPLTKEPTKKSLIAEAREDASALQSDFRKRSLIVRHAAARASCGAVVQAQAHSHALPVLAGDHPDAPHPMLVDGV